MSPIRGLTQSEKHRLYVEGPEEEASKKIFGKQVSKPKIVGSRVLECPQNTIEERKLKKNLAKLEHERQRREAELTTQKHMLRMDHKNFLDSSQFMPGFRFHRNGESKNSPKGGHRELYKSAPVSRRSASTPALQNRVMSANRLILSEQIDALKKELRLLKRNKKPTTSPMKEGLQSRIHSNKTYLRAHTNDSPFNKPGALSPSSSPRKSEEKVDVSAERFSRKSSKPNCIACECTFHSTNPLETTERKKISELKLKWRSPPKGYFLKSMSSAQALSPSSTTSVDVKSKKTLQASSSTPLEKKGHHQSVPLSKTLSGPPDSPVTHQLPPPYNPPPRRIVSPELLPGKGKKSKTSEVVRPRPDVEDEEIPGRKLRAISRSSPGLNNQAARHRPSERRVHSPRRIKSQMERDEELLRGKVQDFVSSLPANKPSITKWRPVCPASRTRVTRTMDTLADDDQSAASSSKTHIHQEREDHEDHDEDADSITWSRYNRSPTGASHIMSDIYLANVHENADAEISSKCSEHDALADEHDEQEKAFADLLNCRYLRIPTSVQRAWE